MDKSDVFKTVATEVANALRVDIDCIEPDTFLIGDLGAESIDLVDLTFRIEKAFQIRIPEGELFEGSSPLPENLRIRDVVTYIDETLSKRHS
ncbi:MAG: phosphopantetheine-binding protein [Verrucomicrobiota bacterium]